MKNRVSDKERRNEDITPLGIADALPAQRLLSQGVFLLLLKISGDLAGGGRAFPLPRPAICLVKEFLSDFTG